MKQSQPHYESYWKLQESRTIPKAPTQTVALEEEPGGTVQASNDVAEALKKLTEKVELLEAKLKTSHPPRTNQQPRRKNMVCWNCKKRDTLLVFVKPQGKGRALSRCRHSTRSLSHQHTLSKV